MTAMDVPPITSTRLDMVWMSPAFLEAALAGRHAEAEAMIGGTLPSWWPDETYWLTRRLEEMQTDPAVGPWLMRAMRRRSDGVVVGNISFHGPPDDQGRAELGYTVFEAYRRQGYASEAALALMSWAREQHGIRRFVVSISPANEPSLAMAAKLGFLRTGTQMDDIDGEEYVFELDFAGGVPISGPPGGARASLPGGREHPRL